MKVSYNISNKFIATHPVKETHAVVVLLTDLVVLLWHWAPKIMLLKKNSALTAIYHGTVKNEQTGDSKPLWLKLSSFLDAYSAILHRFHPSCWLNWIMIMCVQCLPVCYQCYICEMYLRVEQCRPTAYWIYASLLNLCRLLSLLKKILHCSCILGYS